MMADAPGCRFEPGWFGWRAFDARGRRVRIAKWFFGVDRSAFDSSALRRWKAARARDWAARDVAARGVWYQFVIAVFAVLIPMPFVLYVIFLRRINIEPSFPIVVALLGMMILLASVSRSQFKPPRCQVEALLRDRACPSCLHNMKEARQEPDGCTICPECGAAWQCSQDQNREKRAPAQSLNAGPAPSRGHD
jgi:hypothetical protein